MNRALRAHAILLTVGLVAAFTPPARAEERPYSVRFGLSRGLFSGVSENDAAAAIVAYTKKLGDAYGIASSPVSLEGSEAFSRALEAESIDMLALTSEEFLGLRGDQLQGPFFFTDVEGSVTEEYLLVARADGPVTSVPALRARSLIMSIDLPGQLGSKWLEILFHDQGLGPPRAELASLTSAYKPMQVVLPVFFKKADACVVTRKAWNVMGELNPQVREQMRVIAASPELVIGISGFRKGLSPTVIQKIEATALASQNEASFRQVMAIFRGGPVVTRPLSVLEPTRALLARYRQVIGEANEAARAAPRTPTAPGPKGRGKDVRRNGQ
jgi:ABC-type phosphate/phosphonate transport system substrate-binding protein